MRLSENSTNGSYGREEISYFQNCDPKLNRFLLPLSSQNYNKLHCFILNGRAPLVWMCASMSSEHVVVNHWNFWSTQSAGISSESFRFLISVVSNWANGPANLSDLIFFRLLIPTTRIVSGPESNDFLTEKLLKLFWSLSTILFVKWAEFRLLSTISKPFDLLVIPYGFEVSVLKKPFFKATRLSKYSKVVSNSSTFGPNGLELNLQVQNIMFILK